ncbi:ABC transporter permease [Pseudonocardia spinosispora]|uniref:ABC transporter permease n=1 Tax=Pseudonocardia spinosispora TaxID=103441 RepID=UPI00048E67FB|nr:ABC-2 family transporter protein [Pseudonocardia spinosispora]
MPTLYLRLVKAGYERYASYGAASVAGLFTNTVFGLLRVAVLLAVVGRTGSFAGYDVASTVTYVWLGQGLLAVIQLWGDGAFAARVRTGEVAVDLARPWDLHAALLATDLGRALHACVFRLVPPVAFGAVFFPFRWPEWFGTWPLFAVSVLLAVVVCGQARFLFELTAFWLLDARGVVALWNALGGVLCGLTVPLAYFPDQMRLLLAFTPFPSIMQVPIDVFSERGEALILLGQQLIWAAVLVVAARTVLAMATRKLVVQGG